MSTQIMTDVLNACLSAFSIGSGELGEGAVGLLSVLISIEIMWAGAMWALSGGDAVLREFLKKIVHVGMFAFITLNFATIANQILEGFTWAGLKVGGGQMAVSVVHNPSRIVEMGFFATEQVWRDAASIGVWDTGILTSFIVMIAGIAALCLYFLVALQVFMTLIEFYLITAFGVILIPWGVNRHTAFIAERYFGAILAQGVKLMMVIAILSIVLPVIESLSLPSDATFTEMFSLLFGIATVGFLVWRAPNVASGLMSGSANLSSNDAVGMGLGMAMAAKSAAVTAGTAAVSGGSSALGAISSVAGGGALASGAGSVAGGAGGAASSGAAASGAGSAAGSAGAAAPSGTDGGK